MVNARGDEGRFDVVHEKWLEFKRQSSPLRAPWRDKMNEEEGEEGDQSFFPWVAENISYDTEELSYFQDFVI